MVCRTSCIIEGNDVAGHIQASVLVEVGADVQVRVCETEAHYGLFSI